MLVVLFRSRRTDHGDEDYGATADAMLERARGFPGFVDFRHYAAEDGERLSVVWWQDEATLRQWRMDEQHLEAQRRGRSEWYEFYRIETAEVLRINEFTRTT